MANLGNETSGSIDFITVFDGRLVQRVPEGTEGAVSRELQKGENAGKQVWEKTYTSASGKITGGGIAVKEFGGKKVREIQVKLDEDIMLQLPMNLLSHFAKALPNVDPSKPVKMNVYKNKKGKTGLNIAQDGEKCEWSYTKDNPNGLPQPVKDELGEWDFREHDKFLILKVQEFFEGIGGTYDAPDVNEEEDDTPPF